MTQEINQHGTAGGLTTALTDRRLWGGEAQVVCRRQRRLTLSQRDRCDSKRIQRWYERFRHVALPCTLPLVAITQATHHTELWSFMPLHAAGLAPLCDRFI